MATFKDNQAREWAVAIDAAVIKRVRAATGVDLYRAVEDNLRRLEELLRDVVLFVDVLYVTCQPQARDRGVSDEEFGRAMFGDAVEDAASVFLGALVDFFPSARRNDLRRALEIGKAIQAEIRAGTDRAFAAMEADPTALLRRSGPYTDSPASAG